jgi:hypothetical protein
MRVVLGGTARPLPPGQGPEHVPPGIELNAHDGCEVLDSIITRVAIVREDLGFVRDVNPVDRPAWLAAVLRPSEIGHVSRLQFGPGLPAMSAIHGLE